jgi:hypothetical protein
MIWLSLIMLVLSGQILIRYPWCIRRKVGYNRCCTPVSLFFR